MAIATDASSLTSSGGYSNSLTISHTVAGADRLLLVGVHCRSATADVTGVTWNGSAMTLQGTNENSGVVGMQWYSLVAPATGTHDVVVSLGSYKLFSVVVYSLTGVDQTTPIEATDFSTLNLDGYGNSVSTAITTLSANARIVTLITTKDDAATFVAGGAATVLQQADDADGSLGGTALQILDATTAGSTAYSISWTTSTNWRGGTLAVKAKAGGTVYTLTAAQGTYAQTGVAAALRASRKLTSAQGTYAQTGVAAGLRRIITVVAAKGTYAQTGVAAALRASRVITAAQGTYAQTGIAANLTKSGSRSIVAAQGTYAQTGVAAALSLIRRLTAAQGTYAQTGVAAALNRSARTIVAAAGAYTLTGKDARLSRPITRFTADQGIYGLTGWDATFTRFSFGDFGEEFVIPLERQTFGAGINDFVTLRVLTEQQEFAVSTEKQYFTIQGRARS